MLACIESDFQKRYIESYSPLPPQIGAICEGDPTEQVFPKKHKLKRKKAILPPAEVQADPIRPDPSHIASEQETLWMVGGSEVPIAKDRTDVMDEEWEFLNIIPQMQQVVFAGLIPLTLDEEIHIFCSLAVSACLEIAVLVLVYMPSGLFNAHCLHKVCACAITSL